MPRPLAVVALLLAAGAVSAKTGDRVSRPAPPRPVVAAITSDVVAVGTVTDVEAEPVKLKPHPDAPAAIEYTVLTVKITDPLLGVKKNTTHLKVGIPTATFNQPGQVLQKDGKYLLCLGKHSAGELLLPSSPPVSLVSPGADEIVCRTKIAAAAVNDPVKALKAESKDDRTLAACALAMYYRKVPPNANGTEGVARPEEESKLLLKVLAEGDWTLTAPADSGNPFAVVFGLGLEDDGWKSVANTPPGGDLAAANKESFVKWLDGKGKDARVKQLVAKK